MQATVPWPDLTELEVKADGSARPAECEPKPAPQLPPALAPVTPPKLYPHTDLGNAELLIDLYGHDLRFCLEWNCWLVWSGTHWTRDQKGVLAGRLANRAARERYRQAADIEDADERKATLSWARKSEATASRHNCLSQAITLPGVAIPVSVLDVDPWFLNLQNGTLHLQTGALREHRREDFLTKITPTSYRPESRAPLWEKMVSEIYSGDQQLIDFVQRALGYSLTGETRERTFFLNHGEGLNGKSTLLETMLAVLGTDYAVVVNPDILMSSKRDGDSPSPQLADLRGARFVLTSESRRGAHLDESVVKRLTGGSDTIVARRLNENPIRFKPTHKIWLATNHKPAIEESTEAIWDRICLIPYSIRIQNPDLQLPSKLKPEYDGILSWLIQGCLRWAREGLNAPAIVKNANEDYRRDSDELAMFLDTQTLQGPRQTVSLEGLYQSYTVWANRFGEKVKSGRELSKLLKERGFAQKRTKRCFVWCGLGLKAHGEGENSTGDQTEITRSPFDHPFDHLENPYGEGIVEKGDQGDPFFQVRQGNTDFPYSNHEKEDHLDHPRGEDADGKGISRVIKGGDQTPNFDHRGSPRSPDPPLEPLEREEER